MLLRLIRKILPAKCRMQLVESAKKWLFLVPLYGLTCGVLIVPWRSRSVKIIGIYHGKFISFNTFFDIDVVALFYEIFLERVYERERSIDYGDIVIDIGGHVGVFTLKAAEKARLVISFEPDKDNLRHLYTNTLKKNNIIVIPKALGRSKGSAKFLQFPKSISGRLAYLPKPPNATVKSITEVEVDTLDSCIESFDLCEVSFIKVDAEGAEVDILRGAEKTLKITRHIAMELHYEGEVEEVTAFLKCRGFEVKVIGNMLYASKIQ